MATTWDISFEAVKNECPAASKLLRLCSYLAPDDIPIELLVKGRGYLPDSLEFVLQDEDRLDEALAALRRYSLIDRRGDKISVHRLVQAVTRDQLSEGGRKGWAAAAMQMVNDDFPENIDYVHTWPECSLLLPHALAMAEHAEEYEAASEATKCLLYNVGIYLV